MSNTPEKQERLSSLLHQFSRTQQRLTESELAETIGLLCNRVRELEYASKPKPPLPIEDIDSMRQMSKRARGQGVKLTLDERAKLCELQADRIEELEAELSAFYSKPDAANAVCAKALDDLWEGIITSKHPGYGDWEYPGQAVRHLLAEHQQTEDRATDLSAMLLALKQLVTAEKGSFVCRYSKESGGFRLSHTSFKVSKSHKVVTGSDLEQLLLKIFDDVSGAAETAKQTISEESEKRTDE